VSRHGPAVSTEIKHIHGDKTVKLEVHVSLTSRNHGRVIVFICDFMLSVTEVYVERY